MENFELRRRNDGLIYRFTRDGTGVYRRADRPDLTIQWDPRLGWTALDPDTATLAGAPWGVPACEQVRVPPEGPWLSYKGAKSYVYDLVHLDDRPGA